MISPSIVLQDYHRNYGYNLEECHHLKSLVDEFFKVEKLKEFMRRLGKEVAKVGNKLASAHANHIARVVPVIFDGDAELLRRTSLKRLRIGDANSTVMARALVLKLY